MCRGQMNVLLISPSENLVEKVAEHLIGIEKDYSSSLVIFPGKRPSHFLYNVLEERSIEGIPSKKVKEIDSIAGENIPEPTAKRLQSLSYFYETFYKRIEEGHFSTRSSKYRAVSENMDRLNLDRFKKVILAGFFALTASEKNMFRSLMERDKALFIFLYGEGMKKKLSDLGITKREFSPTEPEILCYKSPDSQ